MRQPNRLARWFAVDCGLPRITIGAGNRCTARYRRAPWQRDRGAMRACCPRVRPLAASRRMPQRLRVSVAPTAARTRPQIACAARPASCSKTIARTTAANGASGLRGRWRIGPTRATRSASTGSRDATSSTEARSEFRPVSFATICVRKRGRCRRCGRGRRARRRLGPTAGSRRAGRSRRCARGGSTYG